MIEIKATNKWVVVNPRDVKLIEVVPLGNAGVMKHNILMQYYGEEGELDLQCSLTAEEVQTFIIKFNY